MKFKLCSGLQPSDNQPQIMEKFVNGFLSGIKKSNYFGNDRFYQNLQQFQDNLHIIFKYQLGWPE